MSEQKKNLYVKMVFKIFPSLVNLFKILTLNTAENYNLREFTKEKEPAK